VPRCKDFIPQDASVALSSAALRVLQCPWNTRLNFVVFCYVILSDLLQDEQKRRAFEDWYKRENPKAANFSVSLANFEQGKLGVTSVQRIEAESQFFEVPVEKMISNRIIELSEMGEIIERSFFIIVGNVTTYHRVYMRWSDGKEVDSSHYEVLALFLLYERYSNPNSQWKPWLGILFVVTVFMIRP
jgi:hypothetical protein